MAKGGRLWLERMHGRQMFCLRQKLHVGLLQLVQVSVVGFSEHEWHCCMWPWHEVQIKASKHSRHVGRWQLGHEVMWLVMVQIWQQVGCGLFEVQ